jgi:hypothetical protein
MLEAAEKKAVRVWPERKSTKNAVAIAAPIRATIRVSGVRVRLAPGVEPERAIAKIKEVVGARASAVRSRGHPVVQRDEYVRWTTNAEVHLASVLDRTSARVFFNSSRHRDICSMPAGSQRRALGSRSRSCPPPQFALRGVPGLARTVARTRPSSELLRYRTYTWAE